MREEAGRKKWCVRLGIPNEDGEGEGERGRRMTPVEEEEEKQKTNSVLPPPPPPRLERRKKGEGSSGSVHRKGQKDSFHDGEGRRRLISFPALGQVTVAVIG